LGDVVGDRRTAAYPGAVVTKLGVTTVRTIRAALVTTCAALIPTQAVYSTSGINIDCDGQRAT
jgi:hypothetical protein